MRTTQTKSPAICDDEPGNRNRESLIVACGESVKLSGKNSKVDPRGAGGSGSLPASWPDDPQHISHEVVRIMARLKSMSEPMCADEVAGYAKGFTECA